MDAALGGLAISPLQLAQAYAQWSEQPQAQTTLEAMRTLPLIAHQPEHRIAWKTGTSSARRDAWCVAITDDHVIVVWLGHLRNISDPHLVGGYDAKHLCGQIALLIHDR